MRLNRRSDLVDFQYSNQNLIVSVRDVLINEKTHHKSKVILDEQDNVSVSVHSKFQTKSSSQNFDSSNKYRLSIIYFKNKRMFQTFSNLFLFYELYCDIF